MLGGFPLAPHAVVASTNHGQFFMKSRGRKSIANLTVLRFERAPIEPPAGAALNEREAEHFRKLIACKPADHYDGATVGLLVSLVRSLAASDRLSAALNELPFDEFAARYGLRELNRLLDLCERQARLTLMLMTRLRMTHQTTMRAETAAAIATHAPTLPRPWKH